MFSNDELYQIHLASLDILERTGMVMGSDIGLKLMKEAAAEKLVNLQEELSDKTGNPCMIDEEDY